MTNQFVKAWNDFASIPSDSLARRALYAVLIAAGVTMTGFGSIFMQRTGPIPYGILPDVRPFFFLGSGFLFGLYASGGKANRRALALWGVIGYVIAFHLEEATVHWIGPFPGSITGSRVGILGTSGSLIALLGVLLMHVEVESIKLSGDLASRGATHVDAQATGARLRAAGTRRLLALTAGVAGLGAFLMAVSPIFGETTQGGAWVLIIGAALLLALALLLSRWVPKGT
ncbi:MAG: hypothetical protein WDA16_03380 [Candidatus Thermoplasmatota archaeon]